MNVNFNYPLDNALIQGKFVKDGQCPKDFDGHLEVEVSGGNALDVADAFNAMSIIQSNDFAVKIKGEKNLSGGFH